MATFNNITSITLILLVITCVVLFDIKKSWICCRWTLKLYYNICNMAPKLWQTQLCFWSIAPVPVWPQPFTYYICFFQPNSWKNHIFTMYSSIIIYHKYLFCEMTGLNMSLPRFTNLILLFVFEYTYPSTKGHTCYIRSDVCTHLNVLAQSSEIYSRIEAPIIIILSDMHKSPEYKK